jgi:hypothetical protein
VSTSFEHSRVARGIVAGLIVVLAGLFGPAQEGERDRRHAGTVRTVRTARGGLQRLESADAAVHVDGSTAPDSTPQGDRLTALPAAAAEVAPERRFAGRVVSLVTLAPRAPSGFPFRGRAPPSA